MHLFTTLFRSFLKRDRRLRSFLSNVKITDMFGFSRHDLRRRQSQWDAFHRWESAQERIPLPIEERVAWYVAARQLSQQWSPQTVSERLEAKVDEVRRMRERLAHLKVPACDV